MHTKVLGRAAGGLYLAVAILGGLSEGIRSSIRVPGDATGTAANIVAHAGLLRLSLAADLTGFACFLGAGLILYGILKSVSPSVAIAMLALNATSVGMQALNLLNQVGALLVATDPTYAAGMSGVTGQGLATLLLDLQHQGYLIAQVFFGLYLAPLGYLVYRSPAFNKVLGVILGIGCGGYLAGVAATYLSSGFNSSLATPLGMVGGLAEVGFLLWLLVRSVNVSPAGSTRAAGMEVAA